MTYRALLTLAVFALMPAVQTQADHALRPIGPGPVPPAQPANEQTKLLRCAASGELVFTATVDTVQAIARTASMPPNVMMHVAMKDLDLIKGEKPAEGVFRYSAVQGVGFAPEPGQKVVAVAAEAPDGPGRVIWHIHAMALADTDTVAAVKKAIKDGPTSQPDPVVTEMDRNRARQLLRSPAAGLVLITATVADVAQAAASNPYRTITLIKPETLRPGDTPDATIKAAYPARQGQAWVPARNARVVALVLLGPKAQPGVQPAPASGMFPAIQILLPANDANIAWARQQVTAATQPDAQPGPVIRPRPRPLPPEVVPYAPVAPFEGDEGIEPGQPGIVPGNPGPGQTDHAPAQPDVTPSARRPRPMPPVAIDDTVTISPRPGLPAPRELSPEAKLVNAVKTSPLVFVATIANVTQGPAAMSDPPQLTMTLTFKDTEMIKGVDPGAAAGFSYRVTQGRGFEPKAGDKVLVVANAVRAGAAKPPQNPPGNLRIGGVGTPIRFLAKAEPDNVALARKTAGPTSQPDTPATQPAAAGWTPLFSTEKWYTDQPGNEQEFTGTLEAVPQADVATTLMRTSLYRLGSRSIYTGARKVDALDKLVGKKVVIRGKPYDIELEGQGVSEIWPAAIRADAGK